MRTTRPLTSLRKTRGRPAKPPQQHENKADLGTPELALKRAHCLTEEAIDTCLRRGFINELQHRSALHLRWLHTIRYGAPGVTALDISRGEGRELHQNDDEQWRKQREEEYNTSINLLRHYHYERILLPIIIHNERPDFLKQPSQTTNIPSASQALLKQSQINQLREGLELLLQHWKKRKHHRRDSI